LDCSQFSNDYDVLRQLPFPIVINPITEEDWVKSIAKMDEDNIFVTHITIAYEDFVPPSIFCLLNLEILQVDGTPFKNGSFSLLNGKVYFKCLFRHCTG
jgi:hypothetical protein